MPKFVLNAAGDQFFLPDSSQFYYDELKGPKSDQVHSQHRPWHGPKRCAAVRDRILFDDSERSSAAGIHLVDEG